MIRYIRGLSLCTAGTFFVVCAFVSASVAQDIKLRMKGSTYEITGKLQVYTEKQYVIELPSVGIINLDADRFDCISENCPTVSNTNIRTNALREVNPRSIQGGITIAGSNAIGNSLMPALVEAFAEKNGFRIQKEIATTPRDTKIKISDSANREVATVDLRGLGTSTSFKALETGRADVSMSSRRIRPAEVDSLGRAGLGDMLSPTNEHVLGLDGLVVIVAEDNPAVSIPLDKLAAVLSGKIRDWSQLGLPPGAINVYAPDDDSGTFDTINQLILRPANTIIASTARRISNHKQLSDQVAGDPLGIGIVGIAYQRNAKILNVEMACGLIMQPSVFAMKTEEYPLTRRLFLYTPSRARVPLARALVAFALSGEAQPIVKAAKFIDQSPDSISFKDQGSRIAHALNAPNEDFDLSLMQALIKELKDAVRLTTTLRFKVGAAALENKARQDIARLVGGLKNGAYAGRQIMLLGFADSVGGFPNNLVLAQNRADAVRAELLRVGGSDLQPERVVAKGYGELAPVACNLVEDGGRFFNRRVEVWVR